MASHLASTGAPAPPAAGSGSGASSSSSASTSTGSGVAAAAASSSSGAPHPHVVLPSFELFFPSTSTPLIQHGQFTLSGQDCISLARTVDLLARCGFTPANDARFSSLLALWTFVHRYHRNTLSSKALQVQQARSLEPSLMVKNGLFTPIMHKQLLLQMKAASLIWVDQHIAGQMAQGVTFHKEIPTGMLEVLRAFTKPAVIPSLVSVVDAATQQALIKERALMVQNQCMAASTGGALTAALASAIAAGGGNVAALVASDPSLAFFQANSLHSLQYPPNAKQVEAIPAFVGSKFMSTDACTLVSDLLYAAHLPQPNVDARIVKQERDRMVKHQMKQRKEELDIRLHEIRDSAQNDGGRSTSKPILTPVAPTSANGSASLLTLSSAPSHQQLNSKPPAWMEIDALALGLVPLQRKIRNKILRALPLDQILKDQYRTRKDVEQNQKVRDKMEKKTRMATEKHLKKTRRNFLNAVTNHCRDFQTHHRELHKRLCKAVCAGVVRYWEEKEKRLNEYAKSQEKARLAALKDNDEEGYVALLKEAKNERLLNLLKQTDEYMDQLSSMISAEQAEHASKHATSAAEFRPTADGHIPSAGEFMHGNVFSSSVSKWKKSDAELLDEAQEETPEEADRKRLLKIEEAERRSRARQMGEPEEEKTGGGGSSGGGMVKMEDYVAPQGPVRLQENEASASVKAEPGVAPDGTTPAAAAGAPGESQSSRKLYYSLAHRKQEGIVTQPTMLKGGKLRAYQLEGLQWLVSLYNNQLNGILADEMGLGKTVQSLSLIAYLMEVKHNYGPYLIIVPMSTLHNNWEFECDRWLPGIAKVVYDGDKERRRYLRENFIKPGHFNIVMTTFEYAMRDKATLRKIPWAYMIIDEAHRLKNPSCLLFGTLVSTHDGRSVAVEQLNPATDVLVGPHGAPVRIVDYANDRTTDEVYTIEMQNGAAYTVTPGHLVTLMWLVDLRTPWVTSSRRGATLHETLVIPYSCGQTYTVVTLRQRIVRPGVTRERHRRIGWSIQAIAKDMATEFARHHSGGGACGDVHLPPLVMDEVGFQTDEDLVQYGAHLRDQLNTITIGTVFELPVECLVVDGGEALHPRLRAGHRSTPMCAGVVAPTSKQSLSTSQSASVAAAAAVSQLASDPIIGIKLTKGGTHRYAFMNVQAVKSTGGEADRRYLLASGVVTHNCKLAQELITYPKESRRVALTGTPLQNDLTELWALLNFLHPSVFPANCVLASTRVALADGRAIEAGQVKPGDWLTGEDGQVARVKDVQPITSNDVYTITSASGRSYSVTHNHRLTLRLNRGPRVVFVASSTPEQRTGRGARMWCLWVKPDFTFGCRQWRVTLTDEEDADLPPFNCLDQADAEAIRRHPPQAHVDELTGTRVGLRTIGEQYLADLPPSDKLVLGQLIERTPVEVLASAERLRLGKTNPFVSGRLVPIVQTIDLPVEGAQPLPTAVEQQHLDEFTKAAASESLPPGASPVCLQQYTLLARGDGQYTPLQPTQPVSIVYQLHGSLLPPAGQTTNPRSRAGDSNGGHKALTFLKLDDVHQRLHIDAKQAGLAIHELAPTSSSSRKSSRRPTPPPSARLSQAYDQVCLDSCLAVLSLSSCVSNVVAFGRATRQRWMELATTSLVQRQEEGATASRVRFLKIVFRGRPVTIFFAPHPACWARASEITTAVAMAHGLAEEVVAAGVQSTHECDAIVSIVKKAGDAHPMTNITVAGRTDAQKRFALADGTLTHNSDHGQTFAQWFSSPFDKMAVSAQDKEKHQGMNEEERLLVINRLHAILRPFMLRREKRNVETDLADKIEKVLRCFVAGTPITMADHTSCPIEQVPVGAHVLAYAQPAKGETRGALVRRQVTAVLQQGVRECVQLTFLDGRTLVCTPDHRLLRADGTWVEAKDFVPNRDAVLVGARYPHAPPDEDEFRCANWRLQLEHLALALDMQSNRSKSIAFFRILGSLQTNGALTEDQDKLIVGRLYLGHSIDVTAAADDIELLTGARPSVVQTRNTWQMILPANLTRDYMALGLQLGQRGQIPRSIPSVLTATTKACPACDGLAVGCQVCLCPSSDQHSVGVVGVATCPLPLVRAFLGGFFGGDGLTVSMRHCQESTSLTGVACIIDSVAANQARLVQTELTGLFGRCGIHPDQLTWSARTSVSSIAQAGLDEVPRLQSARSQLNGQVDLSTIGDLAPALSIRLRLDLSHGGTAAFHEKIGFVYCCRKQQRLEAAAAVINTQLYQAAEMAERVQLEGEVVRERYGDMSTDSLVDLFGIGRFFSADVDSDADGEQVAAAAHGLPLFSLPLVRLESVGRRAVYDLVVPVAGDANDESAFQARQAAEASFVAQGVVVHNCTLTPMQKSMYEAILMNKVTMHNRIMQLRKICNHPILFHPYIRGQAGADMYQPDESLIRMCGKFTLLDQILFKLQKCGHRVLIFNQMTKCMDVLEDYCRLRNFTFLRLDGGTSADVRTESVIKYNAPDSPYFIFMLSTKAGGLGLNLQSADTVILFDSDWNPQADAQAMARSHRIGQKNQCLVLRFITTATVEEKVLTTATTKLSHEQMVIQAGMFHEKYSHNASRAIAAEAMAKERQAGEDDTGDDDEAHGTDDFISRTLARSDAELAIFQQMDRDAKQHEQANNITRGLPDGKMPKWCWDWCLHGPNSTSVEQGLVPFSEKLLDAARAKIHKTSEDNGVLKARKQHAAIVEVNTSDSEDEQYDTVAEASGVNDAALDEEQEKPLNYDDLEDEPVTPAAAAAASSAASSSASYGTAAAKKPRKSTAAAAGGASTKKPKAEGSKAKRKREDTTGVASASPAALALAPGQEGLASAASTAPAPKKPRAKKDPSEVKPRASKKKKAAASTAMEDDLDGYQPLSYSDAEGDTEMVDYSTRPTIAATSTGGIKLVLNRTTTPSPSPAIVGSISKKLPQMAATAPAQTGNTFKLSIPRQ